MKRILLTGALFTAALGVYGEANAYCTLGNKKEAHLARLTFPWL